MVDVVKCQEWRAKGFLPISGGVLDQAEWIMDAMACLERDMDSYCAEGQNV